MAKIVLVPSLTCGTEPISSVAMPVTKYVG